MRKPAKPLLFVDIDGVLSLFGFLSDSRPPGTWINVDGVVHLISATASEHLQRLAVLYDLVWCSGWEEKADEHLPGALGVPKGLPHLTFDGHTRAEVSGRAHWKLDAIDEWAGDRPLAWVDDAFNEACWNWARDRCAPTLLVATTPAVGLVDEHAAALSRFAAAHASAG
jgi:hypothetical protein